MRRIHKKLSKLPDAVMLIIAVITALFVGFIDLVTGYRLAFSVFYLIPIFIAARYLGLISGISISILSAVLWFLADSGARGGYPNNIIPVWNTLIRLSVFLALTFTLHQMRVAQKKREDLTNFIVHDLRTPLTILLEGLYLLQDDADEKRKILTDLCVISCNRMNTLIDSILDVSKFESGKMQIDIQNMRVRELVEKALEGVSVWAKRNEIKMVSKYETDRDEIKTDEGLFYRVLINLLSNAIKWSPSGSTVTIRVSEPERGKILFSIEDEGTGIPRTMSEKVFDQFTQIKGKTALNVHGSGLGLNFCKLAVEKLGGKIWINSGKDKGANVMFDLPV
ncbi:MAG: HAMP domain-containing sensor histidine kinase [Candidatus Omnitrophota bacterium]|nr:HAMP domain-containing histidine kinase [Candidatus Omnitrophota bacterium]